MTQLDWKSLVFMCVCDLTNCMSGLDFLELTVDKGSHEDEDEDEGKCLLMRSTSDTLSLHQTESNTPTVSRWDQCV